MVGEIKKLLLSPLESLSLCFSTVALYLGLSQPWSPESGYWFQLFLLELKGIKLILASAAPYSGLTSDGSKMPSGMRNRPTRVNDILKKAYWMGPNSSS